MKYMIVTLLVFMLSHSAYAQKSSRHNDIVLSSGISMMLYQSVYSSQNSSAFEISAKSHISEFMDWQAGARLGFNNPRPEGFIRFLATPIIGRWLPLVGIEFGLTGRAQFDEGDKLLREARESMESDISPVYIAAYSAPLSLRVKEGWHLSILELHVGTHLGNTGRTMRFQVGIVSLGMSL